MSKCRKCDEDKCNGDLDDSCGNYREPEKIFSEDEEDDTSP